MRWERGKKERLRWPPAERGGVEGRLEKYEQKMRTNIADYLGPGRFAFSNSKRRKKKTTDIDLMSH